VTSQYKESMENGSGFHFLLNTNEKKPSHDKFIIHFLTESCKVKTQSSTKNKKYSKEQIANRLENKQSHKLVCISC